MMNIEHLAWDSSFFNKKIGRITLKDSDRNHIFSALKKASVDGYQLVYLYLSGKFFINEETLIKFNGKLVDRKADFNLGFNDGLFHSPLVEEYKSSVLTDDLENLAYLSGKYSRFYTDSGFESKDYYRLYNTWILKSIKNELADKVFVVREHGKIVGLVTLSREENKGKIGLLAVSESVQGRGYGKQLIEACKEFLAESGIYSLDVVTQFNNQIACKFYKKCGFENITLTNIYHFWL